MLNIIKNTINRVFASGVDSDASAFITATGLSGTTQKSAITTLVKDLKSSGLWSKVKAVYPMVTDIRNLTSYSEDFSDGSWTKGNSTITTNSTTAPNGTLTADSLVENTLNTTHLVSNTTAITTTANDHTLSVYAKKANRDWLYLNLYNGTTSLFAWFNLNTGAVGTVQSGLTAAIQDVGNGWYRLSVTRTLPSTVNCFIQYGAATADNTTTFVGNGLVAAYLWGAQLELGSTASAYQPILTTPAAYMASQMKYNLKDARDLDAAFRLTWSGGWTYSATGATPNGTNAYANTYFIPSTNLTATSQSSSIYSRTNANYGSNPNVDFSSVSAGGNFSLTTGLNAASIYGFVRYGLNQDVRIYSPANRQDGFFIGTRTTSTSIKLWRFNSLLGTTTIAETGISTVAPVIGAENNNGVISNYTNRQYAFASMSDGLSDQDALLFGQIVEKYQVALSRGVQAAQSFYYNSAYSNEANTYLYSTQITGTTQVSAINTLINGLKANNLWTKMKAVYPFVTDKTLQADMAAQMKFNLVNPQDSDAAFRLAFSGGWTYSTNGAQPNGTNGYADTKLNPSTVLSANNIHLSYYSRTNSAVASSSTMGADSATDNLRLIIRRTSDIAFAIIGNATKGLSQFLVTDSRGLFVANAPNSTTRELYKNSTSLTPTSQSGLGLNGTPNANLYLSAYNNNGVVFEYDNKQCAFSSIGDGLSSAEVALLNQLVTEYQTTLSRNV